MPTQHDPWHAPSVPHAHPSESGPSRLPAGPQGRSQGVWHGLRTSLGLGLVIVLLASLGGPAIASDRSGRLLVAESFDRSDTETWGTTDSGQRWRFPKASVGLAAVADGGLMTLPAPQSRRSALLEGQGTSVRDMTMKFSFSLDRMPGRGSATILATARKSAAGAYRALVRVAPRGGLWLSFSKQRRGSQAHSVGRTVVVPGWRYAAGQTVNVHFEAIEADATQLRLKVWPAGTAEPGDWQLVSDDVRDDVSAPGRVGLGASLNRRVTNAPLQVRFGFLMVRRAPDVTKAPVTRAAPRRSVGGSPAKGHDQGAPAPAPVPAPEPVVVPAPVVAPAAPVAPKPTPAPTPAPTNGLTVPSSIDSTGSSNASSKLQAFINSAPDGSTIVFKAGGTYRLDTALVLSGRRNLTLEGNGARLNLPGTFAGYDSIGIRVEVSTGTTIRNFTMVGNNSEAGTSAACCSREAQHGIAVLSADATLIEDMDIRRVWGDCVYVNYRTGLAGDWSDGVTFRDSSCTLTGRHGVGIIAGRNLRIERNVFDQIGFMIVDIEPNDSSGGASDVLVADNTIGSYGLTDQYRSPLLAAAGPDTGAAVRNVTVTRNTVAGNRAGYDGAVLGLNITVKGDRGPRSGFTVTDNVAQMTAKGPLMTFTETDGVAVTGNSQPLSSGELATFPGSTNVTYGP